MPNHVTHRVIAVGHLVPEFKQRAVVRDGAECIDFNQWIPMPESLSGEFSSNDSMAYAAFYGPDTSAGINDKALDYWLRMPWMTATNREEAQAYVRRNHPAAVASAQRMKKNIEEHGHPTWYEWCRANWGTKWNAYSYREVSFGPGRFEFLFETAWSPPVPIFNQWADEFPTLLIGVASFDEGWCFAMGGILGRDYHQVPATREMYKLVYGEPLEDDDGDLNEVSIPQIEG